MKIRVLQPRIAQVDPGDEPLPEVVLSQSWSSRIFWMVGQVIKDPSLGFLSPCEVVPWVLILISSPRVLGK
jgi:hypothetical protein